MAAYYITLLSISVTNVHCAQSLDSDMKKGLLSREIPKFWFNHVRKFLHRNIKLIFEHYKKQKYFDFHFILLSIKRTEMFKQSATNLVQYNRNCSDRWEKMEKGIVKLTSLNTVGGKLSPGRKLCGWKIVSIWIFRLHKHYRLNITFDHLSFSMSYHHSCDFGNMVINSSARYKIKYCGIHSEMRIFPPNSKVTIDFIVEKLTKFSTIFFHSIIDPNNIITIPSLMHDNSNISRWTLYFLKTHIYLHKFMLRVHTYQYLVINVTDCRNCSVKILDGPDFMSPSLKPFSIQGNETTHHHNNYQLYLTSSFQCVIYLFHFNTSFSNEIFKHSSSKKKSENNIPISPFKNASHFTFPNNQYCSHKNVCIIPFQTNAGYRLNVSMRGIYSSDQGDILCSYAGLSMYDIINQSYIDIYTICKPSERNIYSNTSKMLLVYYSFKKYSSFSVELGFSTTMCKVVELNLCTLSTNDFDPHFKVVPVYNGRRIDIRNIGCTVYQVRANISIEMYKKKFNEWHYVGRIRCRARLSLEYKEFVGKTADIYLTGSLTGKITKY